MCSSNQTHVKNIVDYMLSNKRNQAEAKAGLTDNFVYKASLESPLNGRVKWDWPFPDAIRPAARDRNPFPARRNTDHLELNSPMASVSDTSFTNPNVLPSHFCEDSPYTCDPAAAQEFHNTIFEPEFIALLNDTDADVTAAISALDTDCSFASDGHPFNEAPTQTAIRPATSLAEVTDSVPTADHPIVDMFTPAPTRDNFSVQMACQILNAAPTSSFGRINRPVIISPPYSVEAIDLTDSPPKPTTQTADNTASGTKRATIVPMAKSNALVANGSANSTKKHTQTTASAQRKPRARTPKRYSTPKSPSPRMLRRIAPTPPASENDVVFKTPQRAPPDVQLNSTTPMSLETQKQLYEQKYPGQQSIYGNRQQQLRRMNQMFQNNHRQEQINRELHLNQAGQQQPHDYNQLSQATQPPSLIQSSDSFNREAGRASYLQQLQQARQQQLQLMQTVQASQQLTEDERHAEFLQMAYQKQLQQSTQTFMYAPHKVEDEQRLSNMPLANPQRHYLMSPVSPQTQAAQAAQRQIEQDTHTLQLQQAYQQQALRRNPQQQLPRSMQALQPAQQQMAQDQQVRCFQHQNQICQQQQYQRSPLLTQSNQPLQYSQLSQSDLSPQMSQLVYPPQQMQVAPPNQAAHRAGLAYGTQYPNKQLQAVPLGQAAHIPPPSAQQYQSDVSAPAFKFAAGQNLPIDRMQFSSSPVPSSKRSFEFVDNVVPDHFVANPKNHGRWFVPKPKEKRRIYLGGSEGKKARTALRL
ncbi:hypothetical protein PENANT_c005G08414 [Penicillium antarcticum]|uniref:Uncharacterized protein n=1 Tax=Penicillium antarcticum TaxID=416450 RepID=A0A1V6QED7_9EURO|nr:hypothetical protein PENANT_c005G08414 [Penicillium antarcticum]